MGDVALPVRAPRRITHRPPEAAIEAVPASTDADAEARARAAERDLEFLAGELGAALDESERRGAELGMARKDCERLSRMVSAIEEAAGEVMARLSDQRLVHEQVAGELASERRRVALLGQRLVAERVAEADRLCEARAEAASVIGRHAAVPQERVGEARAQAAAAIQLAEKRASTALRAAHAMLSEAAGQREAQEAELARLAAQAHALAEARDAAEERALAEARDAAQARAVAETQARDAAEAHALADAQAQDAAEARALAEAQAQDAAEARALAEARKAADALALADARGVAEAEALAAAEAREACALAEAAAAPESPSVRERRLEAELEHLRRERSEHEERLRAELDQAKTEKAELRTRLGICEHTLSQRELELERERQLADEALRWASRVERELVLEPVAPAPAAAAGECAVKPAVEQPASVLRRRGPRIRLRPAG